MLNIRLYKKLAVPKTWLGIINYDSHEYKDDDLISEDDTCENFCLIDNKEKFESELKQYKIDLTESYLNEDHVSRRKTKKEIDKEYYSSGIMRSFRISINHIETDSLHKPNDDENTKRQNIINFYKLFMNEIQDTLNKNNRWKQEVLIIKADLHFDQTNPHIHFHVSNLRKKFLKKLNRECVTCNIEQSDLIRMLNKEKSIQKNKNLTINEIFTQKLRNKKENLDLINRIDLKKLYPEIYDVQLYKTKNNIKNLDLSEILQNGQLKESYEGINHKNDKKIVFKMTSDYLNNLNLSTSSNHIDNRKKLSDVTLYCWKQSLALAIMNYQIYQYDLEHINDKNNKNKDEFKFDLSKLNDNEYIDKVTKDSYELGINIKIIQPKELKLFDNILLSNISKYCPELKSIEQELIKGLNLFKNLTQEQILNNQTVKDQVNCSLTNLVKENLKNPNKQNNNKSNNNFLLSSEQFKSNKSSNIKKKYKQELNNYIDDDYELVLSKVYSDKVENTNYVKLKNVYDIEKEEKLKQLRQLSR